MSINISQQQLLTLLLEASAQDHDTSTMKVEELIRIWVEQLKPYMTEGKMKHEEI